METKTITRIIAILLFSFFTLHSYSQTNISAGNVYGTWEKKGSPFKINGNIVVPKDSTLRIEKGVKVEFQGSYSLEVKGSVQATGAPADTISFTAANKSTGWGGIRLRKTATTADSSIFHFCKFEYRNGLNTLNSRGVLGLDTATRVRISNCLFQFNKSQFGAGIWLVKARLLLYNSVFQYNEVSSNISTVKNAGSVAIVSSFSTARINYCLFYRNKVSLPLSSTDSSQQESRYVVGSGSDDTFILQNSNFIENNCTSYPGLSFNPSGLTTSYFLIQNCNFYRNQGKSGGPFSTPVSTTQNGYFLMDNVHFDGNIFPPHGASGIFGTWQGNYTLNRIKITSSSLNCSGINARSLKLSNSYLTGIQSIAFNCGVNSSSISNSIITNNDCGIAIRDGGTISVVNSVIAYNGNIKIQPSQYQGGIIRGDLGAPRINLVNNIIQGNRVGGKMYNLMTTSGTVINTVKNNVLEGGIDSALSIPNNQALSFGVNTNNIFDTVIFIKPPKGAGAAFSDTTCDFRVANTCSFTSKTLNAGLNSNGFINPNPSTDFYGNPRIKCNNIDIGPYELEGGKQNVGIDTEPTDQSVCPKTTATIAPTSCGAALSYQWQKSSNGSTFANISGANAASYGFIPTDSGYYRLIITQAECNKKDTSRAAKIAFKAGGKMNLLANLKDSTLCSKQPITLQANISNGNSYQWQESANGTAFSNINGATSNPYNTVATNTQWYRLIAKNNLCNYSDTFAAAKITANPLPTPNLGADASIPNSGNKVLNPGTFTAYNWSTGASTPTLTVDKTNLSVGANSISVQVTGANGCKARDTIVVTLEPANGLLNPHLNQIKVYPVPFTKYFQIDVTDQSPFVWSLYNNNGQIVAYGQNNGTATITTEHISSGHYELRIIYKNANHTLRVIKP